MHCIIMINIYTYIYRSKEFNDYQIIHHSWTSKFTFESNFLQSRSTTVDHCIGLEYFLGVLTWLETGISHISSESVKYRDRKKKRTAYKKYDTTQYVSDRFEIA